MAVAQHSNGSIVSDKSSARTTSRKDFPFISLLDFPECRADTADEIIRAVQRERNLLFAAVHDGPLQTILLARLLVEKLCGQKRRPSCFGCECMQYQGEGSSMGLLGL